MADQGAWQAGFDGYFKSSLDAVFQVIPSTGKRGLSDKFYAF